MINKLHGVSEGIARSAWLKALICASAMACFSLTPAFAQCTLNGSSDPTCRLTGPLVVNTYTDTSGSNNISSSIGALTYGSPGTITIFGGVRLVGDTSLNGTGTLTLSNGQIGTDGNGRTLTNAGGSIVGWGIIGSNGLTNQNLSLNNSATINANSSGNTLSIQGTGSSIINSGTFEATGGGILTLATTSAAIDNNSGNITSTGSGSTVNVNTTIQGGTLNTSSGGILQTAPTGDTLDGSTSAGAITLSDGSTYTAGAAASSTTTNVAGTLNLGTTTGSTLALGGALRLVGDTAINGGTSGGSITMSSGQIGTDGNGRTLTNNALIQGSGVIGSNATTNENLSLANSGTINANAAGTLSIQGTGSSIVNTGTLEATAGGTLSLATSTAIDNSGGTIASTGTNSVVNVNTTIQGGSLTTSGGGVMQTAPTGATLNSSTSAGAITLTDGSTYTAGAAASSTTTNITGTLNLGTTTGSTLALGGALRLIGDTTINVGTSGGSITMSSGQIGTDGNGRLLTNNGLIQGSGVIGSNATTDENLSLANTGTINANTAGTLSIQGTGGSIANTGTLEATAGGTLTLATSAAINNNGGLIASTGTASTVNVNTTIQGGTLTTSGTSVMQTAPTGATLDASSQGAIALSDGSTYTAGAAGSATLTDITGTLKLGTTTGSTLALGGALGLVGDTTIDAGTSGGSITMASGQIGTDGNGRLLTNNALIQGSGIIGSNNTTNQNLSLANNGTINANSPGDTLSIQGTGGSIVNAGTFEATNGGTLTVATQAAVNNQNGTILAGTGSTVNLSGVIQGGLLTTQGTGLMQTSGTVTLDGLSLGAITFTDDSTYTAGVLGTSTLTNIKGQLNLGTVTGSTLQVTGTDALPGYLRLTGDTTLSGPGSVVLNGGLIGTEGNGRTLTNNSLIQGTGVIGSNVGSDFQNLSLNNTSTGTINANSSGNTLSIQGTGSSIVNTGLLEATSGGTLFLTTQSAINNSGGGNITAGTGSTVNVNTSIQGGTLNTLGTGVMQTLAGSTATLDGSSNGAITISDGSTYTSGGTTGTLTSILGTLNLGTSTGGTLALSGQLRLVGDTTFAGPGSVTMSGNGQIGTDGNLRTLTNNSTIQGSGLIGSNVGSLTQNLNVNNNTGTILANVSGQTLTLGGTGTLTNTGTLQANAGSTLLSSMSGLSGTTFSSSTLNTGTYNAYNGTIQINALGTGGGEIVNNAATILLSGVNSSFLDGSGDDALSKLADNSGSLSILAGRVLDTPGEFTNSGTVDVGSTSQFNINLGESEYFQTGGTTLVDGTLGAGSTVIDGGFLEGVGTVDNAVTVNDGTVAPGDPPGTLNIDGLFDLTGSGDLLIGLAGTLTNQYDNLDVTGTADLNGTLKFDLQNGFNVASGETFLILESTDLTGSYSVDYSGLDLAAGLTAQVETVPGDSNNLELVIGGTSSATPEPSTWLMLATGLGALAGFQIIRRRRKCA